MKKVFTYFLGVVSLGLFFVILLYVFDLKYYVNSLIYPKFEKELPVSSIDTIEDEDAIVDTRLTYEERMKKGKYFLGKGFLNLALNEFTIASRLEKEKKEPIYKLAHIHFIIGNYDKSRLNLQKILEVEPDNIDAKVLLGKIYIKQNDFENAKSYFFAINEKSQIVLYYQALFDILYGQYNEAKNKFVAAKKLSSTDTKIAEYIDLYQASFTEYELYSDGQEIFLMTLFCKNFNETEEYELAIDLSRRVIKQKEDYRDVWIMLGYAYLNLEQYNFALNAFDKAYKLDPEKSETQYFLGLTYYELNNLDSAIAYLEVSIKNGFEPKIQALQKLAEIYMEEEDYDKSVKTYEKILKINDSDIESFIKPVWLYLEFLDKPKTALELAEKASIKHPDDARTYNLLGWAYIGNKDYDNAAVNLKKSIDMDKSLPEPYYNFGRLYEEQRQYEKALKFYKKAYELDSESSIGVMSAQKYNDILLILK